MRTLLLTLCVFLTLAAAHAETNGLKLCGREFVRAVVYTCGGSRWRREQTGMTAWQEWNQLVTNKCCSVGCQKKDLSHLCRVLHQP